MCKHAPRPPCSPVASQDCDEVRSRAQRPGFFSLYGSPPAEFENALRRTISVLENLMREFGITWWDVYLESDIGAERVLLVEELGLSGEDRILVIGCGRGYFSFTAARVARLVIGIDLMNSLGDRLVGSIHEGCKAPWT